MIYEQIKFEIYWVFIISQTNIMNGEEKSMQYNLEFSY